MRTIAQAVATAGLMLLASSGTGIAQGMPPWAQDLFGRHFEYEPRRERPEPRSEQAPLLDDDDAVRSGGARPSISPVAPPIVAFAHNFPANSIVIDTGERKLYYVLGDKQAYAYTIGVGRDGFGWTGTETVSRKQAWPDWHPPAEMREREPSLPKKMTGGISNPLGAMALYLGDTLYRVHGTNDEKSIGSAESSGCFRMLNSAALHLASITEIGTPVTVVKSLPQGAQTTRAPDAAPAAPAATSQPPAADAASNADRSPAPARAADYRSLREYTLQSR